MRKLFLSLLLIAALVILGAGCDQGQDAADLSETEVSERSSNQIDPANQFGWLTGGGGDEEYELIRDIGGGWARPHLGGAVWDIVQNEEGGDYDFEIMDEIVNDSQAAGVNLLITIWPFAEWDQAGRSDVANCAVPGNDEFLPRSGKEVGETYLPQHRCNPNDWQAYHDFVVALVERYDGDGINDMPGLAYPIKYWEVMNEPDLSGPGLTFYKQTPRDYADLLEHTYNDVKDADLEAQVLIAGAAGGDPEFLQFYETMFTEVPQSTSSFDIGNVHCISNDQATQDFNVKPYQEMLGRFNADQSIWVTEAEALYGNSKEANIENTKTSTRNALSEGAEKIFYTTFMLTGGGPGSGPPPPGTGPEMDSAEFKEIINSIN